MHCLYKTSVKASLLFLTLALAATQVVAADKALLDILLGNGAITQAQYDTLLAEEELQVDDVAEIRLSHGSGLQVRSADGSYEVEIGGRLHMDYVDHSHDSRMGTEPVSGTQIRRARVELDGVFNERWAWAAELDFAGNEVEIKDFKLGFDGESGPAVYIGNQKQPYSLSFEMSSNDIPFIERSIDNALVEPVTDRALGLRSDFSGKQWFASAGLFGESVDEGGQGNEGWGTTARFVYAPWIEDSRVLHLGVRHAWRTFEPGSPVLEIADETSDFSGLSIVGTGELVDAENIRLVGPEFALALGPLFVFGEYNDARIERSNASALHFDSWHVGTAWTLTGESRADNYGIDAGEFKNLSPASSFDPATGSLGIIELAARYAAIDLNDGDFIGGEEEALSLALNWQPNHNVRLMMDWTRILDTDGSNMIRRFAPDTDVFSFRTQYNY